MSKMTNQPNITNNMILAAKDVFLSMAWEQAIRPVVEGYQKQILDRNKFTDKRTKEVILDPKHTYMMSDEDFAVYLKEIEVCREAAGLKIRSEGNCPLLEARNDLRIAERAFAKTLEPLTKVTIDQVLCTKNGLENYRKYLNLGLKMVLSYDGSHDKIIETDRKMRHSAKKGA